MVSIIIWSLYGGTFGLSVVYIRNSIVVLFSHYVVGICGHADAIQMMIGQITWSLVPTREPAVVLIISGN